MSALAERVPLRDDGLGRDLLAILPALALSAFWALSALFSGAYFPSAWYPAAIAVVAFCPLLLAAGWRLPVGGTRLALAMLGAFAVWTALSILWADAGGHALEATNKLLLAFASAFVFALTPWTERRAAWLLGFLAIGVAAASVTTLLSAASAANPAVNFIEGRFSEPLGYAGGSAAFAALAVWPALALSARRESPTWLRAAMFGVAVAQAELSFLPQSRGAVIGLVLSAIVFLFFSSSRGWALLRLLAAALLIALTVGPILDVYSAANNGGSVAAALDDAVRGLALAFALAVVLGAAFARLEMTAPELPGASTAVRFRVPALALGAVAVLIAAIAVGGSVSDRASEYWHDFKTGQVRSDSDSHLTSVGDPERYDYWRVALKVTGESPVTGIGAGNYQDAYTVDRHDEKHSRYAHNFWLRILSEAGIVGLLLILAVPFCLVLAIARRRGTMTPGAQLLAAGALGLSTYVFAHATVDWVEEFPAVLGPALALPFLAGRLAEPPPPGAPRRQAAGLVIGLAVAGVALVALIPAYLSLRLVERAEGEGRNDPAAAYRDLERASYLNPLSSEPDLIVAEIATANGEYAKAEDSLKDAIHKEDNWYPHFQLATLTSFRGRQAEAIGQMRVARRLDPVDELVEDSLRQLRNGKRLTPLGVEEQIRAETEERFFHLHPKR